MHPKYQLHEKGLQAYLKLASLHMVDMEIRTKVKPWEWAISYMSVNVLKEPHLRRQQIQ